MSLIESSKTYTGNELETIFFRPMLKGPSAEDLGVKVIYNMPMPTTIQLWSNKGDVLQSYTTNGWSGGSGAVKEQKTINMNRVKAELGFSASDYFSLVFENITNRSDINMEDLTGSELEIAETDIFRRSIAESIRGTMWVGDVDSGFNSFSTFDGFLKSVYKYMENGDVKENRFSGSRLSDADLSVECFETCWTGADQKLRDLKSDGELVYFVTSDIYHLYELYLDSKGVDNAYVDLVNGRKTLSYHGIPVVDLSISHYLDYSEYSTNFCMLSDRRNLVMAVNTADFPGSEVRMWYNPDEMENRQRAVFMAGCDVIDPNIVSFIHQYA